MEVLLARLTNCRHPGQKTTFETYDRSCKAQERKAGERSLGKLEHEKPHVFGEIYKAMQMSKAGYLYSEKDLKKF